MIETYSASASSAAAKLNYKHSYFLFRMLVLKSIDLWRIWEDPFGNKLYISSGYPRVKLVNKIEKTSDMFFRSTIKHIADNSDWVYLFDNYYCFLGKDFRLRICVTNNGVFSHNIPPLNLGFAKVKEICTAYRSNETTEKYGIIKEMGDQCPLIR